MSALAWASPTRPMVTTTRTPSRGEVAAVLAVAAEVDGEAVRATLLVRPRGWHLPERHLLVDDEPVAGALFDFGLYFFHCASRLVSKGSGPYFYLPKMESHREARLWNEVFCFSQDALGIPRGTVKATVLIETLRGGI